MGIGTELRLIKLYFKLKPLIDQVEKEMTMKFSTNMLMQILATVGQIFNQVGGFIPTKYQPVIAGILGGAQLIVGGLAHYSNPDATPVSTPFVAKGN